MINKIRSKQRHILALAIIFLIGSVFFRFANLDQKPYWGDESLSSQRLSGYTDQDFRALFLQGEVVSSEKMLSYQRPGSEKDLRDAMKALASQSMHPPLYYLLARFWMQFFGNSVSNPRSLSAVISLLALPCIYWVCQELFESPLVGWMAIALISVSPLHVLYAQEARQYSLWIVNILLSSLALLRAMRINTTLNWGIYAVTLALGLYTHLLHVLVVIGHGLYAIAHENFRFSQKITAYFLASLTAFLLFLPWILVILNNLLTAKNIAQTPSWSKILTPLKSLIQTWIINLSRIFIDFNGSFSYRNLGLYFLILILIGYSVYFLFRNTQKRVYLFLIILIITPITLFIVPDLILGGRRSTPIRYFIPCYLGIQITIAYLLATQLTSSTIKNWQQKLWQITTVALISLGVLSCAVYSQTDTWWNKQREYYHSEVAKIVNQSEKPLVIAAWYDMRTLSHSLASHVALQDIRLRTEVSSVGEGFSDIFVYSNKNNLEYLLKNKPNYRIENTYSWKCQTTPVNTTQTTIWRLTK